MDILFEIHNRLIENTPVEFKRSLFEKMNWDARLIEINGPRGVGKTTLMLQYIKLNFKRNDHSVLYFSADDPYFYMNSMVDTVDKFVKYGGRHIFIDEVHKYIPKYKNTDWSGEIKAIYDRYPGLKIVFSGSSVIRLHKGIGDLSRRVSSYFLPGLSFREFLQFDQHFRYDVIKIEDIVRRHESIAKDISSRIIILRAFQNYLKYGYYAFSYEDKEKYSEKLKNIIAVILESDIPSVVDIPFVSVNKMKKLLHVLATSSPYTPNLTALGEKIGVADHRTLLRYLDYLEKATLLRSLSQKAIGNTILRKPEKLYISNTNFVFALEPERIDKGTLREIFFFSQTAINHVITLPKNGDFLLNNQYVFEVGGKRKSRKQIGNSKNAFVVADDIEYGVFNKIPLWLFGFLY
ncbi:AAA family ATPase [Candidatus Sulfidibacterium hydrothermale]|uniref:ATP-binding protein n=1 Tax=Candidatus Sulfidibacterium hydrothermale TaxID=2875962 RepID=UPI001F0ABB78|nr:AAA family ATPase [Candidatus Sulfidibacterium hydrothermale]UBM61606.1 AAA family ATPase [Candidatus Sulfidibacterium hydrothermale]